MTLDDALSFNREFVRSKQYEKYSAGKYPHKKIAILSCMDARLTELVPAALGFKNGDVKIIKNAGAVLSAPFGSVIRSMIVAVYTLGVEEIWVIGHHDCGMQNLNSEVILEKMRARGISMDFVEWMKFAGTDFHQWMSGFGNVEDSVRSTVETIAKHPLIPRDVSVVGMVMDPETGEVILV
ncbi:hypothetical protein SDC9_136522 [bioreactor metagenome]|uniref:Carbonic anhydrase n=1 Tax=bioreactor metagenome TaxID=1076179 RepID=A0A645DKS3_9ZZZZ